MPDRVILLVEDDANDVLLVRRALERARITRRLEVVPDGDAAVAYLAGAPPYADRLAHPAPALVLLDLKLPRRSGHEVLEWMRRQPGTRRIPVVVLTASAESDDVARAYDLGASSYVVKPSEFAALRAIIEVVDRYWLGHNVALDPRRATAPTALSGPANRIHRVAVIDDNPDDRALVRRELGRALGDVEVIEISQRAGFERFLAAPVADVVITDYALGWSDGIAVARDVKSRLPEAIVIMFTATGSEEIAVEAMKSGVDDYVLKSASHYGRLVPALMSAADRLAHRRLLRAAQEERDHALERERRAREQAEKASRLKDEFLATVSHELRTPLNAILGWAHIARSIGPTGDDKLVRALETIERNARAQSTLIEDLLDVSRIVAGLVRIRLQPLDARDVLAAAMDVARPAADAKGTPLRARIADEELRVLADPDRLQQVLWNLLSNAVRFTPAGGAIDVEAEAVDGQAVITVRDSGCGIAPEFLPHVFEPFRQADQSTTRAHGGLGIGLAIARRLVELHGGGIEAASEGEGRGASFTVHLPLASGLRELSTADAGAGEPGRDAGGHHTPGDARLCGVRVLVVEDHEDSAELVRTLLASQGADVVVAHGARECLDAFTAQPADVLVCDIAMPGDMDGYTLVARVRSLPRGPTVPAVALTASTGAEDVARALDAGFDVHVGKPIAGEELIDAVARSLQTGRVSR